MYTSYTVYRIRNMERTELEMNCILVPSSSPLRYLCGASEANFVHIRMSGKALTKCSITRHYIEHTCRERVGT